MVAKAQQPFPSNLQLPTTEVCSNCFALTGDFLFPKVTFRESLGSGAIFDLFVLFGRRFFLFISCEKNQCIFVSRKSTECSFHR